MQGRELVRVYDRIGVLVTAFDQVSIHKSHDKIVIVWSATNGLVEQRYLVIKLSASCVCGAQVVERANVIRPEIDRFLKLPSCLICLSLVRVS